MSKKKILICDDEESVRESLNLILSDMSPDYEITMASDGNNCLGCLKNAADFDLIMLDVKMPGPSGLDILKQIKKAHPALKVIVATGYRSVEMATEALKHGASDYIIKPFESKDVKEAVKRILG
jgi:DNA-binding NtrC family response regulator